MVLAVDIGTTFGGIAVLISAVVGVFAFLQKRYDDKQRAALEKKANKDRAELEQKAATREEVQQAFDLQSVAMEQVKTANADLIKELARQSGKYEAMHDSLNSALARVAELKAEHTKCTTDLNAMGNRLRLAEARIAELGG